MPRKPTSLSSVRLIREAAGLTQPQFARRLGMTISYLQKIEHGKRKITSDLAEDMMIMFCANPISLHEELDRKKLEPQEIQAELEGLRERIKSWKKGSRMFNDDAAEVFQEILVKKLKVLFLAAVKRERGIALAARLDRWIDEVESDFKLKKDRESILNDIRKTEPDFTWQRYLATVDSPNPGFTRIRVAASSKLLDSPPKPTDPSIPQERHQGGSSEGLSGKAVAGKRPGQRLTRKH